MFMSRVDSKSDQMTWNLAWDNLSSWDTENITILAIMFLSEFLTS